MPTTKLVRILRLVQVTVAVVLLGLAAFPTSASALSLELEAVATGLDNAVAIAHSGDDRLFLVSKEGQVFIFRGGAVLSRPYLDIRDRVLFTGEPESEQGLLSIAFHPDYASNGFLFAAYVRPDGAGVISRFSVSGPNPDVASKGSERILLTIPEPGPNHNINHLAFGPDGYLYVASGEGGYQPEPRCSGQETDHLLGKILRLDVDQNVDQAPYYGIPFDNPFAGPGDPLDEIWALGLRNPWRFSFDPQNGDLYIADVGQRLREEVSLQPASSSGGENYGFKMMEGFTCRGSSANCAMPIPPCFDPAYTPPVFDYGHDSRHCAIIGGPIYRGDRIPSLRGFYLHGDFCGAVAQARKVGADWVRTEFANDLDRLVSFGVDSQGEVYALAGGQLLSLVDVVDGGSLSFTAASFGSLESADQATITVRRTGGSEGAVSVAYETVDGTAEAGLDYLATMGTLSWADGDTSEKSFNVPLLDDDAIEGPETFEVRLQNATGGAVVGSPATATFQIADDDANLEPCVPGPNTLCLNDNRFLVTVDWRNFQGETGVGKRVPQGSNDSGMFWFFAADNWEMLVKVIDACDFNSRFWVFAAATTNVEYTLRVFDTETGALEQYTNPLGVASPAITDTQAFATCP